MVWAVVLPRIKNERWAYAISLLIGAVGFAMVPFIHNENLLVLPYVLIGCAWAAMLAMPFAFVTNALEGYGHKGAYLGLFNGTICLPQIVAAACGGTLLAMVGSHQYNMIRTTPKTLQYNNEHSFQPAICHGVWRDAPTERGGP